MEPLYADSERLPSFTSLIPLLCSVSTPEEGHQTPGTLPEHHLILLTKYQKRCAQQIYNTASTFELGTILLDKICTNNTKDHGMSSNALLQNIRFSDNFNTF